jgi:ligand-binding sensor domain-containing protein
MKRIFGLILWCCPLIGFAQQSGVGRWQDHYSYNRVFSIVALQDEISAVTENGLFFYSKKENSVRRKTTIQGLTQVGLSASNYDPSSQTQIVGYENGNIDLIQNGRVFNIPDIQRWQAPGSKRINKIVVQNSQRVYLCCDFGIVVLNLLRREILETYLIGQNNSHLQVNDLAIDFTDSVIYAATENGLLSADLSSRRLSDFREWSEVSVNSQNGLPIQNAVFWNQNLIIRQSNPDNMDTIWRYVQNDWHVLDTMHSKQLKVSKNRLFQLRKIPDVEWLFEIREYNTDFQVLRNFDEYSGFSLWDLQDIEVDSENNLWFSTGYDGLTWLTSDWNFNGTILPRGPAENNVYALSHSLSKLYSANGFVTGTWSRGWRNFAVDIFQDGNWSVFDYRSFSPRIYDAIAVAEDPKNSNVFWVASWQAGLVQYNADRSPTIYNNDNSTIESSWDGYQYVISCGDVKFDKKNQLWTTTARVQHHLHKRKSNPSGDRTDWTAYDLGHVISTDPREFIIDYYDQLWIRTRANGLVFFREANNPAGFEVRQANLRHGNTQQISRLNCLVEDKKGYVWLGTDRGILVNYTSRQLFDNPGLESSVEFRTINIAGRPLLENENVTAIAVDGGDRKWIGTSSSGVFLISADGREMLRQFNAQNSPLNSNVITALAINPRTGDVYIGTDKGLMSYGGDATVGSQTEQKIKIFPNPVRADFTGEIAIQGLVENAHVRITDVSGSLIFETTANGGMATWNGNTRNGQRVNPGVYVVFATNDDGSVASVGKIFFNQ